MKWINQLLDKAIAYRLRKSGIPLTGWQTKRVACWDCLLTHDLPSDFWQALASAEGFFARHQGHHTDFFEQPGLAGLWHSNADVKVAYGSSAAYTITLASLATSASLIIGRESTAISNTSNLYDDYLVGGKITGGTTPTVDKEIEISVYGSYADAPTYPDVLDGTDSDETFASINAKRAAVAVIERLFVDATTARVYAFNPRGIKQAFGGYIPKSHGIFVSHNTVAALHATGGNHEIQYTPVFNTVI